jgi:hypothetical protein
MATYEITISQVRMMIDAQSEEEALSEAEQILMESVWDYGSIGVA